MLHFTPAPPRESSSHKGVTWNKCSKKWQAVITPTGTGLQTNIGLFAEEAEAAAAYSFTETQAQSVDIHSYVLCRHYRN